MGDDHGRKRGLFTVPVMVAVAALALSLVTNLVSALFAPEWLAANALWLLVLFGALALVTITLVILEALRSAQQARQDAEDDRARVVQDLPPRIHRDVAASRLPSALLNADRRLCRFSGRQAELKELEAWCTSPDAPSFFILTGTSLVGKTRLTIQLSEYVTETWRVGRLLPSAGVGAVDRILAAPGNHLIVVELGDASDGVIAFLNDVVTHDSDRLRVILVARRYEWVLRRISDASDLAAEAIKVAARLSLGDLRPQGGPNDRERWGKEAIASFSGHLGTRSAPKLTQPAFADDTPIGMVQAHALAVALATDTTMVKHGVAEIMEVLADQEMGQWDELPQTPSTSELRRRCFAAAWLLGADDRPSVESAIHRIPELHDASAERLRQFADWLVDTYPGAEVGNTSLPLETLSPAIAIPAIRNDNKLFSALLSDLSLAQFASVGSRLLNAGEDYHQALYLVEQALEQQGELRQSTALIATLRVTSASHRADDLLAKLLTRRSLSATEIESILDELDTQPGFLRSRISAGNTLLEHRRRSRDDARLANALERLARYHFYVGENLDSVACQTEAVSLLRGLLVDDPAEHTYLLANALVNLGAAHSAAHRYDEAHASLTEAVELYRSRADANASRLATALSDLAATLDNLGRHEEALEQADEALRLARALPMEFLDILAATLRNASAILDHLGRLKEAIEQAERAIEIYRSLSPGSLSRLAISLRNLATILDRLGRHEDARKGAAEAVQLYRALADENPARYLADLAGALCFLCATMNNLGQYRSALDPGKEALQLTRRLVAIDPARHSAQLAESLRTCAHTLLGLGELENALTHIEKSVAAYRQLAIQQHAGSGYELALTLVNFSVALNRLDRDRDALPPATEAVRLARTLSRPDALAAALAQRGILLSNLRLHEAAIVDTREAIQLYRSLANDNPSQYMADLETTRTNLVDLLQALGREDELPRL